MKIFSKTIRLLADLLMLFILIGGVGNVWLLVQPNPIVPDGPDDLGVVQLTVKSLYQPVPMPHGQYILQSKEYATKFLLNTNPANPEDVESLIQIGNKVKVQIKRETIGQLQNIDLVYAYALTLNDGKVVFNTSQNIPRHTSITSFELGNVILYGIIAIPALYFLLRILLCLRRHFRSMTTSNP